MRQFLQILCIAGMAFASYWFISHYLVQSVRIVGVSMVPTLADSDSYLLNRWIYLVRAPRPQEVVVIRDPLDQGLSVKRVIAVPGDTVELRGGRVYVNERPLDEPYLRSGIFTSSRRNQNRFTCGQQQFFVLGDNRNYSVDSRTYGPVPRDCLIGMVVR